MKLGLYIAILLISVSVAQAAWIQWIDCDEFWAGESVVPKKNFETTELVCFYGSGYAGDEHTITLINLEDEKTKQLTVPIVNSVISSSRGYALSNLEAGQYDTPTGCEGAFDCVNPSANRECIPTDGECVYSRYTVSGNSCVIDENYQDPDSDGDGWTDHCDVYPNDILSWVDIDADGYGNYYDCSEFDQKDTNCVSSPHPPPSTGSGGDNDEGGPGGGTFNESQPVNETEPEQNSGGGSGGSNSNLDLPECVGEYICDFWSSCVNGVETRTCELINGCTEDPYKPLLERPCGSEEVIVPQDEPEAPIITGQVVAADQLTQTTPKSVTGAVIILITILTLFLGFRLRRQ